MAAAVSAHTGFAISVKARDLIGSTFDQLENQLAAEKIYNRTLPHGEALLSFFTGAQWAELTDLAGALRHRLEEQTDILDRFAVLGLDPFAPDLLHASLPFPIRVVEHLESSCVVGGHLRACFRDGTVYHVGRPTPLSERLSALAMRGLIGNDVFHEVFHGLQGDSGTYRSLAEVLQTLDGDSRAQARTAIAEAHAWLRSLPGFRSELIVDVVTSTYGLRRREHVDVAVHLLSAAFALGLNDVQVGELVGEAEWSEAEGTYPGLAATVNRLAEEQRLDEKRLAERIEWLRLVERVQGVRAMGLARELAQAAMTSRASARTAAIAS